MSLHDEFGYDVDISLKKIKGKVAKPLKIKLMVKPKGNTVSLRKNKKHDYGTGQAKNNKRPRDLINQDKP